MTSEPQTILLWQRLGGCLAAHWEPNRSAPYDCKWGATPGEAVDRLDLGPLLRSYPLPFRPRDPA